MFFALAGNPAADKDIEHLSEWVVYAKAAKFWSMNPIELQKHPNCQELTGQAWDLMQIELMAESIAIKAAKKR